MTPDDTNLIAAFQKGNETAFTQIYKLLYRPLNLFAFSITRDAAQSQDIVTDSFIKLWNQRLSFDTLPAIRSWLYITAGNRSKDHLRSLNRHEHSHREILYLSAETDAFSEREMILSGVMVELYQQVQLLPVQRRRIFELICFEGKTTSEIASDLNTSTKNVLNQKLKAIHELRSVLLKKNLLPLLSLFTCGFNLAKKYFN